MSWAERAAWLDLAMTTAFRLPGLLTLAVLIWQLVVLRLRSARREGVKVLIGLLIGVALAWAQLEFIQRMVGSDADLGMSVFLGGHVGVAVALLWFPTSFVVRRSRPRTRRGIRSEPGLL